MEKHVPVIERVGNKVKVKVGSLPHPMEQKHYVEWIEIAVEDNICRKYLKPAKNRKHSLKLQQRKQTQENTATYTDCGNQSRI